MVIHAGLQRGRLGGGPVRAGLGGCGGRSRLGPQAAGHRAPGHGADDREPDRAADLQADVVQAGRRACVAGVHLVQDDQGHRNEQQAQVGPEEQRRAEHPAGVGAVLADPGQPDHPAGRERAAGDQQRPGADPAHCPLRDHRHHQDRGNVGQVGQPRPQRAIPPHLLDEQGQEEEHAEDRGPDAQADQERPGPVPAAQQPHGQQRVPAAGLDHPERGQQHRGGGQRDDHLGVTPVRDAVRGGGGWSRSCGEPSRRRRRPRRCRRMCRICGGRWSPAARPGPRRGCW